MFGILIRVNFVQVAGFVSRNNNLVIITAYGFSFQVQVLLKSIVYSSKLYITYLFAKSRSKFRTLGSFGGIFSVLKPKDYNFLILSGFTFQEESLPTHPLQQILGSFNKSFCVIFPVGSMDVFITEMSSNSFHNWLCLLPVSSINGEKLAARRNAMCTQV